jgi:hypothetical protein
MISSACDSRSEAAEIFSLICMRRLHLGVAKREQNIYTRNISLMSALYSTAFGSSASV